MAVFPSAGNAGYAVERHAVPHRGLRGGRRTARSRSTPGSTRAGARERSGRVTATPSTSLRGCARLAKGGQTLIAAETLDPCPSRCAVRTRCQDVHPSRASKPTSRSTSSSGRKPRKTSPRSRTRRAGRNARLTLRYREREIDADEARRADLRPRREQRRGDPRPQGVAAACPHRAPARQVRADRPQHQRHLPRRRRRERGRAPARGAAAARSRPHRLRPSLRRGPGGRGGPVRHGAPA